MCLKYEPSSEHGLLNSWYQTCFETVLRTLNNYFTGGFRESRRWSRDTYPESYITKYTLVYEDLRLFYRARGIRLTDPWYHRCFTTFLRMYQTCFTTVLRDLILTAWRGWNLVLLESDLNRRARGIRLGLEREVFYNCFTTHLLVAKIYMTVLQGYLAHKKPHPPRTLL